MSTLIDSQVQIRLNKELKEKATILFNQLGMSLSEAVRTFLTQAVAEQGMPFKAHIPNNTTIDSFKELENGGGTRYKTAEDAFKDLGI